MATNPVQQHMSIEQYLLLVSNSDRRYEYYDGEVRLMALVAEWNTHAHPFDWSTKSAAKVMAKCDPQIVPPLAA